MLKIIDIYIKRFIMIVNKNELNNLVIEELSRSDISSLIDSNMDSNEFKKKVKSLAAEVVSELFKILWQRNSLWMQSVKS